MDYEDLMTVFSELKGSSLEQHASRFHGNTFGTAVVPRMYLITDERRPRELASVR